MYTHTSIRNVILMELCKALDMADIKKKRLEWIGHVVKMDHGQGRTVNKIFESKPEGSTRRGYLD